MSTLSRELFVMTEMTGPLTVLVRTMMTKNSREDVDIFYLLR